MSLEQIREPVQGRLNSYEEYLAGMFSDVAAGFAPMVSYVLSHRGKAIRPLVVMLAAGLFPESERRNERSVTGAMLIEMMHTASLVHDDIIDEAYIRRSRPSANALWGNHLAILAGDYIISRSFSEGLASGHNDIVGLVSNTLSQLCEGEIIQSYQSDRLGMTRDIYLDIIYKKTALLIGTAAATGAMAADAAAGDVANLRTYGDSLGIAFQIRDDVLDYAPSSQTGKPACGDLRERKINMPLLAVLENSDRATKRTLLKKLSDVRRTPKNVEYLRRAVADGGGIEEASHLMSTYLDTARTALGAYPDSPCRHSLLQLCDYVALRDK